MPNSDKTGTVEASHSIHHNIVSFLHSVDFMFLCCFFEAQVDLACENGTAGQLLVESRATMYSRGAPACLAFVVHQSLPN